MQRIHLLLFLFTLSLPGFFGCIQARLLRATELPKDPTTSEPLYLEEPTPQLKIAGAPPTPAGVDRALPTTTLRSVPDAALELPPTVLPDPLACSPLEGIDIAALEEIISNPFQPSRQGKDDGHPALDFAFYTWRGLQDIDGHSVQAVLRGSVAALVYDRLPYGNMIIVETKWQDVPAAAREAIGAGMDQSLYVLYAHLKEAPIVSLGEDVVCGQELGSAGKTGRSGAPHLHLEVRLGPGSTVFSPMVFYDTQALEAEMENYRLWAMSGRFSSVDPLILLRTGRSR